MNKLESEGDKNMVEKAVKIESIKKNIDQFSPEKISMLNDLIHTQMPDAFSEENRECKKMEGIWEGVGFENIDVESDIKQFRSDIGDSIHRK